MNKNRFRVIYSQARGMFIAVAEIVKSRTKTAGQSSAASDLDSDHISSNVLNTYKKLNPLNFAVVSVLGAVIYTVPLSSIANTQIIADKTAPNSQQPTILNSSNGVTQVNIQTPSAGGVSRNTYTQFDVGQEGAILNNSRNSAQTQIGGWVQGNPWLAKGEAKVILNEVNSSNPSQLKGYLEVAGKSAQVVIANPSGLVCDGCGVINADRFTLTTGQAVMNLGYLESFRVREGQVTLEGKGLNGSLTPYTDIYARALKVNAGLYANHLNVALGQNDITVKDQATPQINTATSNLITTTNTPNFALDVGQMGGMYAGKIYLVGTENGLGVRNAGSINAIAGQLTLSANGDLMNTGNIIANKDQVQINAQNVENSGNISSATSQVTLQSQNLDNSGLISSADELHLKQSGQTKNAGKINAARIALEANQLINIGSIQQTGSQALDLQAVDISNKAGKIGAIEFAGTGGGTGGTGATNPNQPNAEPPANQAKDGGSLEVIDPSDLPVKTFEKGFIRTIQSLNNDGGKIEANGGIDLKTQSGLDNTSGQLHLGNLDVRGNQFINQSGQLIVDQANIQTLSINNEKGSIFAQQSMNLQSQIFNNKQGKVQALDAIHIQNTGELNNQQGLIAAQQSIDLKPGQLNNTQGTLYSEKNNIKIQAQDHINNTSGIIQASGNTDIHAKSLNNQQGQLLANDLNVQLKAQLDNTQGQIQAKKTLTLASQNLSNDQGQISAEQTQLNQQNKLMNTGTIYAEQHLKIENSHTVNQGLIASGKDTSILSKNLTFSKGSTLAAGLAADGKLKEAGDLTVQVDTAVINGNVFAGKKAIIQANQDLDVSEAIIHVQEVELNSKEGSITTQKAKIQAKNTVKLEAKQQLNNQGGQLIANTLSLKGSSLNNQSGIIQQMGESQLDLSFADSIQNQAGQIAANAAQLNIQTGTLNNESGQIIHAGQNGLTIKAQQIDAAQGKIVSNAHLNINAKKINLNQAQTQAHQIKITADQLSHQQGQMVQTGQLSAAQLYIQNTLDNSQGSILSNHGLEINAKQLENQKGILQSAQDQSMSLDIAELFNNTEGKVLSGLDLNIQAQALNNHNAQLQAVNQLNLKVIQQLNNQQGLIAAQKQLTIQANQLNNTQGQIASLDDQVHLELSSINNSSGLVQSGTTLKIQADSIDNQQGKLIAQQDVNLKSQNAALLNQSGQISAGQNIQILSHGLNNDTGLIQAGKNLSIDSQNQDLSNQQSGTAGGLIAQNELSIKNVQQLNNQQGFIGANTSVDLQAQQVQNQKGQIVSSQNLSIQASGVAGEINNQEGKIAAQGNMQLRTAKLNNSAISAAGSQIIAAKNLQINVDQLLNTNTFSTDSQGIDAENIQIYTQQLDNQQGAIRASDHSTLTVEQQLNNTKGLISALKQLNIQSASKLLNINNQKGQLLAGQTLDLTAQHLSGDGQVISLGDATIELTKTYQHEKDAKLQANGQLHFTTQQDLLNAGDIIAGDVLNIQANNIVNTVDHASLQSKQTLLNAQNNLKNLGLINGDLTVLKAKQIDNEGRGRIYGTQLALQADVLNNRPNSTGVAPVIAARQRLDIGVNILNNNANTADYASQANILSAGDFYLGGALNQNNQATGTAQIVNNTGARIEAFGDMHLSSKHVNNTNANFDAGLVLVSANKGQVKEFRGGWKTFDGLYFGGNPNEDWTVYYYDIEHYETLVKTSAPGVIQAGGNLQFENAESIVNDKSQILAGQILDINSIAVEQSKVLENTGVDGINKDVYTGTQELHYLDGRKDKHKTDYYAWMQESLSSQPLAVSIARPYQNLTSSPAVIDQVKADALGIKIEQAASTQGLTKQQENLAENVALNDKKAINSNQVDALQQGATTAQKDQVDVPSAAGTGTEIRAVDNNQLKVPNSALYKVNKDSNAHYLIETDPAFANYKNWLSSDYMLNALGLDLSMQQKRLGDGYYEQRLVQDQIAQLTGHRFLDGYGTDEEQYKALMNNSLSFAKLYGLRPGIALTAAQIAQLTSDIVWLEEKEVTLPDGSKRKALVPQVYVKARVGDLKGDGTLISAETVKINMQGDVLNSAIIAGRNALVLNVENVNQLNGRIQANDITVKTVKDLNIEGGQIVADHAMQLDVGRDFKLNTTTLSSEHQIGDSYFKQTGIDRVAGLYINSPLKTQSTDTENLKTTISIRVGGNSQMKGAEIANNSGSTLIQTVGDVDVGSVNVGRTTHIQSDASNYNHSSYRTDVGSQIAGQGDVYLTGQNIQITGSEISSVSGTAAISAQQDLKITEGRREQTVEARNIETGGSAFSKKTSDSYYKTQRNEAVVSTIEGNKVILDGNNVSIRGSNVISDDLTQIQSKENISITAAENQYGKVSESTVKKSGFTASVSDGVASVGYGKSSVHNKNEGRSTDLAQSAVSSLSGNVNIVAGNDLTAEAAILAAGKDINLIGKNVNLAAADIYQDQNSKFESKTSGVSVGITYSSEAAALASAKKSQESNDFSDSAVGKVMSSAETARKATMAATTPVVFTASHQKINNTNHAASTQSVGTEVTAGSNLNIIATEGDIRSQGAKISAEGDALLNAKNNIHLLSTSNTETQNADTKRSGFSIDNRDHLAPIGVYNDKGKGSGSLSQSVGTELSVGGKTTLQADTGDINIVGSKVVSQDDLRMTAGKDINIQSAQSSHSQSESQKSKGWGSAQISDTERFDGYMANQNKTNSENITQERSQVGSLDGNVTLNAGNNYNQKVADVVAGKDLNITAKSINILDDHNTSSDSQSSKDLKIGLFSRVSSPLIDLVNAVDKAGKSKADDRTQALQGVAAVAQGYQTYSDIQGGALFKAETGIGFSTSKNSQDKSYSASQSNLLNAGGNINLTSTEGDIHLKNTQVKAKENIALDSAKDILLESGQSQQKADGKNSNAGASYGVGVSVGAQTGAYVFVEAGYGQGNNHLDGTVNENTTLNSDSLSIKSKGDTTLKGAQATANRIDADVGGKLNIISQQDTLAQDSEQTGAGIRLQASFGTAWQASGNYSNSKASGSFSSVNEQSGLFAGDGGYHVKADSVDLKGGAIASTASKEKNDLTSNSLTFSNLENQSGYKATTVALSGGTKLGKADGESPASQPTNNENWRNSTTFSPSLPQQSKDEDSSTTYATISAGNINIGGKDTTVEALGIHSDINTANQKVEVLPDMEAVLEKQKIIADATSTIAASARTYSQDQQKKAEAEKQSAEQAAIADLQVKGGEDWENYLNSGNVAEKQEILKDSSPSYKAASDAVQNWGMGGDYSRGLNAVTTALTAVLGGQTDLQAVANTLAPYAAQVIGQQFGHGEDKNTAAQMASHAILGATLAYINGGDPTAGGSAAVASEAAATYFTNQYKDKKEYQDANGIFQPNLLPEDVKTQIRDLTAGIGAVIGGAVGDSTYNAQLAGVIGQNAVENNGLQDIYEKGLNKNKAEKEAQAKLSCPKGISCIIPIPEKSLGEKALHVVNDMTVRQLVAALGAEYDPLTGGYITPNERQLAKASMLGLGFSKTLSGPVKLTDDVIITILEKIDNSSAYSVAQKILLKENIISTNYFKQDRKYWVSEPVQIKGNKVYQRNDLFDPNAVDVRGRSNVQRMEKGLAPLDSNGQSVNLHHMLQKQDGPIAEVTQSFHKNNHSVIHINDNSIPSGIDRNIFNKWRSDYWKQRANDFKK